MEAKQLLNTNKSILYDVITIYGKQHQLIVTMEELSELTKELTKSLRGKEIRDNICEELADVVIMLCQLMLIKNISEDELCANISQKLGRLRDNLNDGRC